MPESFDASTNVLYKGQVNEVRVTQEFADWVRSLRDTVGRARISDRLLRVADGNFGDAKPVGYGVEELRMSFGPGYRIYFCRRGSMIILLLNGGDKGSQKRDIAKAVELARRELDATENEAL